MAISKLPVDVGDENGESTIDERKIIITALPTFAESISRPATPSNDFCDSLTLTNHRKTSHIEALLDPTFMSPLKDPNQRRKEQREKVAQAQAGWSCTKFLGLGDLGGPPLSPAEDYSLHSRYLARANSLNLSDITEMKIVYVLYKILFRNLNLKACYLYHAF